MDKVGVNTIENPNRIEEVPYVRDGMGGSDNLPESDKWPGGEIQTWKGRSVEIVPLDHGYVVKVGCQSFAIESLEKMVTLLQKYYVDPTEMERKWSATHNLNNL